MHFNGSRSRLHDMNVIESESFALLSPRKAWLCLCMVCLAWFHGLGSFALHAQEEGRDFSRWESSMQAFESTDRQKPDRIGGVMFLGSSSMRMWKTLESDFPEQRVINRGFGGSTLPDSIHFFDRLVMPIKPSIIVLYAGDNDVAEGHSAERVYQNFKTFVRLVKEQLPRTKVIFVSIKPSLKRWNLAPVMKRANRKIANYAFWHGKVSFANVWDTMLGEDGRPRPELFIADGLHLSAEGYATWAQTIRPMVQ
jgi:lysophospholipase L1-like esterase